MNRSELEPDRPYDDRTAALQAELVALEERFATQWVETVRGLVAQQLPQAEFTARRMLALKHDLKDRKRALAKLRWKYDATGRRRPDLVDRDVRRAEGLARKIIDDYERDRQAREEQRESPAAKTRRMNLEASATRTNPHDTLVDLAATILGRPTPVPVVPAHETRSLDGVHPWCISEVQRASGIEDLAAATDDEIIEGVIRTEGIDRLSARRYVAMLQPRLNRPHA